MSDVIALEPHAQLCTFRVDDMLLGIDVMRVQEVVSNMPVTPVPLSPRVVGGLINLRGHIVTVIDLRRRLGLTSPTPEAPLQLVIKSDDQMTSLLVDQMGDVVSVDESQFERAPTTVAADARELIVGAYKLDGALVLALDVEQAIKLTLPRRESSR
ncbi:MAG: chemotaxis protein CheW [Polyangiaceae bacterium]